MVGRADSAAIVPEVGEIWSGGGMTVRVIELWPEDARVERLTGRTGLLKRPVKAGVIPLSNFSNGRMRKLQGQTLWAQAILERYGR